MVGGIDFGGLSKGVGYVSNLDYAAIKEKQLSREDRDLKKVQDDIVDLKKEGVEFGAFKIVLDGLYEYADSYNSLLKTQKFETRKIIASEDTTKNYASISVEDAAKIASYDFKIKQTAKAEIKESKDFNPSSKKIAADTVTITLNDNGVKSNDFSSKYESVVDQSGIGEKFKSGYFKVGDRTVELKVGDNLEDICRKINEVRFGDSRENIIAEVKPQGDKYYIWIRTKELAGNQNTAVPFQISDTDQILGNQFNREFKESGQFKYVNNEKVEIKLDSETSVEDFVKTFNNYSKKTYLSVSLEDAGNSEKKLRYESLLTGQNNKINLQFSNTDNNNNFGPQNIIQNAQNTEVSFNGHDVISSTNQVKYNGIHVTAIKAMGAAETITVAADPKGFADFQEKYNTVMLLIAKNIQKKDDAKEFYKYVSTAPLHEHHFWLESISTTLQGFLTAPDSQGNSLVNYGLRFEEKEIDPQTHFKDLVPEDEEGGLPVKVFMMSIDENKLAMNIDKVLDLLKSNFRSSDINFRRMKSNVDIATQGVSNFDYSVDYDKARVRNNLSQQFDAKDTKLGLTEGSILLNNVKIEIGKEDTVQTFVDKVNKVRNTSGIKALVADEKVGDTTKYRILLDKNYIDAKDEEYQTSGKTPEQIRAMIRGSLNIFDHDNLLKDLFAEPPTLSKSFDTKDAEVTSKGTTIKINGKEIKLEANLQLKKVDNKIRKALKSDPDLKDLDVKIIKNTDEKFQLQLSQESTIITSIEDPDNVLGFDTSIKHKHQVTFYDTSEVADVVANMQGGGAVEKFTYMKLTNPLDKRKGGSIEIVDSIKAPALELDSKTFSSWDQKLEQDGNLGVADVTIPLTKDMTLQEVKETINSEVDSKGIWADIIQSGKDAYRFVLRKTPSSETKLTVEDPNKLFDFHDMPSDLKLNGLKVYYSGDENAKSNIVVYQGIAEKMSNYLSPMVRNGGIIDKMAQNAGFETEKLKTKETMLEDRKKRKEAYFNRKMGDLEALFAKLNQQMQFMKTLFGKKQDN